MDEIIAGLRLEDMSDECLHLLIRMLSGNFDQNELVQQFAPYQQRTNFPMWVHIWNNW